MAMLLSLCIQPVIWDTRVMAQAKINGCDYYDQSMRAESYILSDTQLTNNWEVATGCLAKVLAEIKPDGSVVPKKEDPLWDIFIRATGALRILIASQASGERTENLVIKKFREHGPLNAISTLVFGARSDIDTARLNAIVVLGNVIDNQTVCIPIDHLYDQDFRHSKVGEMEVYQVRGRANLLAVVAVVAPWAYHENYENIDRVQKMMSDVLNHAPDDDKPKLKNTFDILVNLQDRMAFQQKFEEPHKDQPLPSYLRACAKYMPIWGKEQISYK